MFEDPSCLRPSPIPPLPSLTPTPCPLFFLYFFSISILSFCLFNFSLLHMSSYYYYCLSRNFPSGSLSPSPIPLLSLGLLQLMPLFHPHSLPPFPLFPQLRRGREGCAKRARLPNQPHVGWLRKVGSPGNTL